MARVHADPYHVIHPVGDVVESVGGRLIDLWR